MKNKKNLIILCICAILLSCNTVKIKEDHTETVNKYMEHIKGYVFCSNGFQFVYFEGKGVTALPNEDNSKYIARCSKRTLISGETFRD